MSPPSSAGVTAAVPLNGTYVAFVPASLLSFNVPMWLAENEELPPTDSFFFLAAATKSFNVLYGLFFGTISAPGVSWNM